MFKVDSRKIKLWGQFFWEKREKRKSKLSKKGKGGRAAAKLFHIPYSRLFSLFEHFFL